VAVFIDLDTRPAPPSRAVRRRPRLELVVVASLLLLLGGAVRPDGHDGLRVVASSGDLAVSTSLLTPSVLYTADVDAKVRSRPLTPGGPQWSTPVPTDGGQMTLARSGSVVIVGFGVANPTTFLDAATGAVLWQTDTGDDVVVLGDRAAVWTYGDDPGRSDLGVADLRTGHRRWSRVVNDEAALVGTADGRVVISFDHAGRATAYAAADGRVLAARRILGLGTAVHADADLADYPDEADHPGVGVTVVGDRLYAYRGSSVAAYRAADLVRLWQTTTGATRVTGCGPAVCATAPDGVRVLDPATGSVRRFGTNWRSVDADGVASAGDGEATLVDLTTGRDIRALGRGEPAGDLMLQYDDHGGSGRTWVLGLRDGRPIGTLPGVVPYRYRCAALGDLLTCPTGGLTVTVWQIRR
jgi:hypothetical protein